MHVREYIVFESRRQSATDEEIVGMTFAWQYAASVSCDWKTPRPFNVEQLAYELNGSHAYRKTPATFNQGPPAIPAQQVVRAMNGLFLAMGQAEKDNTVKEDADALTKEFLLIHPYADGNGRVASLIWNWMKGTLDKPEPLPYFFGEQSEDSI